MKREIWTDSKSNCLSVIQVERNQAEREAGKKGKKEKWNGRRKEEWKMRIS